MPSIQDSPGNLNVRWWLSDDPEVRASELRQVFTALQDRDQSRQDLNIHHLRLYGDLPVEGLLPTIKNAGLVEPRITWNVVANVCDFITNRIGRYQPVPRPLPVIGNYSLRRKSKLLERFFEAQFEISRVQEKLRQQFLDAVVFGTGVVKVYPDKKEIKVERVFPSELLVDNHEAIYGEPRQLLQKKWVSRDVLREIYLTGKSGIEKLELERVLETAGRGTHEYHSDRYWVDEGVNDMVLVIEAWHLPSAKGAGDGKHAIIVDSGELFCEGWTKDYFPFIFLKWKDRLRGFWGVGLAETLNGIQVEINRMLIKIQAAYQLLAKPLILVESSSKVVKSHITSDIGTIVPFVGAPPIVWTPANFHPEFYAHLERLDRKAYELAGISQDSVTSERGAESGVAKQFQRDIETERFSIISQNRERAVLDLAYMMIDIAKDLHKQGGFRTVSKADRHSIASIDWNEIDMESDQYTLVIRPQSSLPSTPAARIDRVVTLFQAGLVDPQEALRLMDLPDLESVLDTGRAASDDLDRVIEQMLDEGVYEPPEPYMDLNLALVKVQDAYNRAKRDGVPEEHLDLLQRFLIQVHMLEQRAQAEQMKQAQAIAAQNQPQLPGPGAPPAVGPEGIPPTAATGVA